jgi:hypothetical protein
MIPYWTPLADLSYKELCCFRGKEIAQKVKIKWNMAKRIMGTVISGLRLGYAWFRKWICAGVLGGGAEARAIIILTVYLMQNGLSTISFQFLGNRAIQHAKASQISELRSKLTLQSGMVTIQSVSRLQGITAGGDFLGPCDQKRSYKHVSDFGLLRSYDQEPV